MSHLVFELLLWIVLAFFVGCILGCVFRRLFGPEPELVVAAAAGKPAKSARSAVPAAAPVMIRSTVETAPAPATAKAVAPAPAKAAPAPAKAAPAPTKPAPPPAKVAQTGAKATPPPAAAISDGKPQQPKGIAAPRGGKPDNLRRISGIGAKIERTLHGLGYFHFDQIASWTPEEVRWVDEHLNFKGRIARDEWQRQARLLAGGKPGEAVESEADKKPDQPGQRKLAARKRAKK